MDSAYVFEEPPSDICMVDAPEVYKLLGIPTTMIPILETSIHEVYYTSQFPEQWFAELPSDHIQSGVASLAAQIAQFCPELVHRVPWFAEWALWWAHTAPIPQGAIAMSTAPAEVYALLRVSDRMRRGILRCTGGVYKAAGLPDVRFSWIPKEVIDPVVEELGERLQMLFPDMRRGQGWFARWALGRRHKSRGRSGAGCR